MAYLVPLVTLNTLYMPIEDVENFERFRPIGYHPTTIGRSCRLNALFCSSCCHNQL